MSEYVSHRPYGKEWREQRERALERDDEKCVECGISREKHRKLHDADLHVHHATPRAETDDPHRLENLKTLCEQCHTTIHSGKFHRGADPRTETKRGWPKVEDDEILSLFDDGQELSTPEIADKLPIIYQTTYNRLQQLVDMGFLTRRKNGNVVLWSRTEKSLK